MKLSLFIAAQENQSDKLRGSGRSPEKIYESAETLSFPKALRSAFI